MRNVAFFFISFFIIGLAACSPSSGGEDYDLVDGMGKFQRYSQKLSFSLNSKNWDLADFYLHEIEEIAEDLVHNQIMYEGNNISQQVKQILIPSIDDLKTEIDGKNEKNAAKKYTFLIGSCNTCHIATQHQFIKITMPNSLSVNPYNQQF
ncbi:MAG: hypothetical protein ACJATA_000177 [Sphingobacteriales bacterium]|jgi:hypothetical protein